MKALIVDNYDSFTYNLYQLVASLFEDVKVKRNDQLEIGEVNDYDTVFISPGPGRPGVRRDVGLSEEIVRNFPQKPILGVCLGHQIIGHVYGAKIVQSSHIMHGKNH
jgi:Anthranilate/para-aminobenzoate synthases component II